MMYDAIVVGLGPAGSTAMHRLAMAGWKVLGFDRAKFPRRKVCGGCLSLKIDNILNPGFHSVIEQTIRGITLTYQGRHQTHMRSQRPVAYMVMRERFDAYLLEAAIQQGGEARTGEQVAHVEETPDSVSVTTTRGTYRGRFLIAADGANSVVARLLGVAGNRHVALALEGEVRVAEPRLNGLGDEVVLDLGAVPFGYGWVFPKSDHLSVGVAGLKEKVKNPKPFYTTFVQHEHILASRPGNKKAGWLVPVFRYDSGSLGSGRCLFVGDAAQLVDPFLGEGIYYAIRSGQLAAESLLMHHNGGSPVPQYKAAVRSELFPDFYWAKILSAYVYRFPWLGHLALSGNDELIESYFDILRGESTYQSFWVQLKRTVGLELLDWVGLSRLFRTHQRDVAEAEAAKYDSAIHTWKHFVAPQAYDKFAALLSELLPTGGSVLNAGAGSGETTQLVLQAANPGSVIALDRSTGMLRYARRKLHDYRLSWEIGSVYNLPFSDNAFDAVISSWTLETLEEPRAAVSEFLRVIKPSGFVLYMFSTKPAGPLVQGYTFLAQLLLNRGRTWRFLPPSEQPYHSCEHSRLLRYAKGLVSMVLLRKCCSVTEPTLPCSIDLEEVIASGIEVDSQ